MATYLDGIVAFHRARAAADARRPAELEALAAAAAVPRDFAGGLTGAKAPIAVVAEIKRRSPSRGPLAEGLDPARTARAYAAGGAACLSVLTDTEYFGGSLADLDAARRAVDLPVLRKDFTVCEADLYEARAMGADAVLLIVAALDPDELARFSGLAKRLGLAAIVEVHDAAELATGLEAGAEIIGVNQRDLHSFEVDTDRALALRGAIPPGVIALAESGITSAADLGRLARAGYDAALIGESLVTAPDPAVALSGLLEEVGRCS